MRLFIIRHTTAADPHGYSDDAERALTELGREQAHIVAKTIAEFDFPPELIFSSTYTRALQTAEIISTELTLEPPEQTSLLCPGFYPDDLMSELSTKQASSIAVVGHSPDVAYFTASLCFGEAAPALTFSKGAVAIVDTQRPLRRRGGLLQAFIPVRNF